MATLTLSSADPTTHAVDVFIVGLVTGDDKPAVVGGDWPEIADGAVLAGASGKAGEVTDFAAPSSLAAEQVIAVGLGKSDKVTPELVRRAAGLAARAAAGKATAVSTLSLSDLAASAEGHVLGAYVFDHYKDPKKAPIAEITLAVSDDNAEAQASLKTALIGSEAVSLARDFVNTAPNHLPPAVFADRAAAAARAAGLDVEILDEVALEKGGYGGILGVGSGSTRPPRLVRISYTPAKATTSVALVGKGITFDTGGISIKPASNMDHMTSDMGGAAAVVATMIAVAALKLPLKVTATVPMAENMPSGSAYRPGDVLRHRGGKTVHVLNTDAEGRLILADAIVRACEDEPDYLLETSTLTGAQVVALGTRTMGVMGSTELRDQVAENARDTGEGGWAMPLPEELRTGLDSPLADIANVSNNRSGGMLVGGHYLSEFVADGVEWAHLDVAGPAFNSGKAHGYTGPGGTGLPVRTLIATLQQLAEK